LVPNISFSSDRDDEQVEQEREKARQQQRELEKKLLKTSTSPTKEKNNIEPNINTGDPLKMTGVDEVSQKTPRARGARMSYLQTHQLLPGNPSNLSFDDADLTTRKKKR